MEGRGEGAGEGIMMSGGKREGAARQRGVREVTGEGCKSWRRMGKGGGGEEKEEAGLESRGGQGGGEGERCIH